MKARLVRLLDAHHGGLLTVCAVLLYLALLAGQATLGGAYLPVVAVLAVAVVALGTYGLARQGNLAARLRSAAPYLLLGGVVLLALVLRLWQAPQPRPAPDSDEAFFVEAARGIMRSSQYIPSSLRYPSLLVYVELVAAVLRFVTGASANLWTRVGQVSPEQFYGWGRGVVALASAATLWPAFRAGEKLYSRQAGILAALFLALLPMHVAAGGIVAAETLAALLALLSGWFALRLLEDGRVRWALAAGACVGLAAAAHYPAGLVMLAPLLAVLLRKPAPGAAGRGTLALLVVVAAWGGFLLGCPAAVAQTDRLVAGLAEAARAYFPSQGAAGTGLAYLLRTGLGWGPAVLVLLGAGLVIPRLRRAEVVLFAFPVALYLALLLPRARFPRDLVLLAPYLALLAAAGLDRAGAWLERRFAGRPWVTGLPWVGALLGAGLFVLALIG